MAYQRDGGCSGWEATIKTFEELRDWGRDGVEYIYIYDLNGQWLYLPMGLSEISPRNLKEDLEHDTVLYSEPPDLADLLGTDWIEEQEADPSMGL